MAEEAEGGEGAAASLEGLISLPLVREEDDEEAIRRKEKAVGGREVWARKDLRLS